MYPTRHVEQPDDPEVASSPFRDAFGRARVEALAATPGTRDVGRGAWDDGVEFEYRLLKRRGKRSAEEAVWNALGRQGWELVGVTGKHAAFKRPL